MNLFLLAAGAMLSSALGTKAVRAYALKRLMDLPNSRSSHTVPTPRGGGLAMVLSVCLAVAVLWGAGWIPTALVCVLAGCLPIAAVGFWDDHGHVRARIRLALQFAAVAWCLYWIRGPEYFNFGGQSYHFGLLGFLIAAGWAVWMLNLFNFMDGIDGIAGIEVLTVAWSAAGLLAFAGSAESPGIVALLLSLGAAAGGFLWWNWPPARIFMGDVGSGFVGLFIALLALSTIAAGLLSPSIWLILPAVFIGDATFTLARRMFTGQPWSQPHRSHAYQRAAQYYGSHRAVTLGVLIINLAWILPLAIAALHWPWLDALWVALAYAPVLAIAWRFDAGKP